MALKIYCILRWILTFALTFSKEAGLTSEKQIKNTSCKKKKEALCKNHCHQLFISDYMALYVIVGLVNMTAIGTDPQQRPTRTRQVLHTDPITSFGSIPT